MIPVADIAVLVNGAELPAELYASLLDVSVKDDTDSPSELTLSLVAWDDEKIDVSRVDDPLFDMGSEIEIKLGQLSALATVCKAEVVSVELELSSGQVPRFTVRAYDQRHRLRRGTKTRTFAKMKDSDIAAHIAREHGLSASCEDSGLTREYVAQFAQSDLDFLRARAMEIGFEVVVDAKTLIFRPASKSAASAVPLKADTDLTDFSARLKAGDQVGAVEVRGWDPEAKKAIVGRSSGAAQPPAEADSDSAYGKATLVIVDRAVTKQDEADKAAAAAFEQRARKGMSIDGSSLGRSDLRAGVEVDVQNAGARFSGTYRLTTVSHKLSARGGYVTSFSGERKLT